MPPEYVRAVRHLTRNLDAGIEAVRSASNRLLFDVWEEGAFQVYSEPVFARDLPSAQHWRWNQPKSHQQVMLQQQLLTVDILKLCPRKRRSSSHKRKLSIPRIKMWWFKVTTPTHVRFAFWCERVDLSSPREELTDLSPEHTLSEHSPSSSSSETSSICPPPPPLPTSQTRGSFSTLEDDQPLGWTGSSLGEMDDLLADYSPDVLSFDDTFQPLF
jgi:hypothetical protein